MKINKGIAVGLAVSVVLVSVVSAQYALQPSGRIFQAGVPLSPAQAFAPHPRNFVNVSSQQVAIDELGIGPADTLCLVGGQEVTLVTVPMDRWFLLTNLHITRWDHSGYIRILEVAADSTTTIRVNGEQEQEMVGSMRWDPSPLVFSPGSRVVLRNITSSPTPYYCEFLMSGYFVDD